MSIVCCKLSEKEIKVAADSISVYGYTQEKAKDKYSKLCEINGMIIGSVGLCEESSMLQIFASTRKPASPIESEILNFIAEFAEWKKKRTEKYTIENDYLIAFDGRIFKVSSFFIKEILKYEAIGAGRDYALSTLYLGHDVEKAVEVACELSIYCEKPVQVLTMPRGGKWPS
jgi:ATP-dependent protease HslVU (ClpYQ) peptidase subunit